MCVPLSAGDLGVYVYPRLFVTQYKRLTIAERFTSKYVPMFSPNTLFYYV